MRKKGVLEIFKFSIYVSLPIGTIIVFNKPEALRALLEKTQYVVYPPDTGKLDFSKFKQEREINVVDKDEKQETRSWFSWR
eukprot:snap_masked-scaffold_54-processed-gene-0.11-mRNA-1 protein AED:0.20 eAED:1.00 QI:0/-1/0/1/-1/1/1/0/80